MPTTPTTYVPYDPLRICDLCGDLHRKSEISRMPGGEFIGPCVPGWRTAVELDRANARQKPFRIRPVKNAKPETWSSPDSYEGDEGEIFNFLARSVATGARYENVTGGDPAPLGTRTLQAYGWTAQYLYGLIVENKRPLKWITQAKTMLATIATALRTRQVSVGVSGIAAAAGAFLESGATSYVTQDAASCGLALLYAYRILGTPLYLVSARLAASYLRNVQAIGSCANQFTSSDAAGTARLYTGAVASEVSRAFGADPTENFYSTHAFYPGDLLTLRFWKELTATDGDQTIGTTTVVDGFPVAPAQPMSQSILDMRSFWANGTRDSTGETYTGLSATTPREYFNAYPASKPNFPLAGTGRWQFQDGDYSNGTMISSQNFAMALASLFNYEGSSTQVAEVSDWLRTFTSNPAFETAANVSISALARAVTGDFVATDGLTTLLTVRDSAADYAAVKMNGSGLYDWGAFGLISTVWGSRNLSSFIEARKVPLGRNQRFYDGQRSDGDHMDWITNRGLCGLSLQTAFGINTDEAAPQAMSIGTSSVPSSTPYKTGLWLWTEGNFGLVPDASGFCGAWEDQSGNDHGPTTAAINGALFVANAIDGQPGLRFTGLGGLENVVDNLPYGARTIWIVGKPVGPGGGSMITFRRAPAAGSDWVMYSWLFAGTQYLWSDGATNISAVTPVNYSGAGHMYKHVQNGSNALTVTVDNNVIPKSAGLTTNENGPDGFTIGGRAKGGYLQGFDGWIAAVLVYVGELPTAGTQQTGAYLAGRYSSLPRVPDIATPAVNDAVRAAQFATSFRIAPVEPAQV